MRGSCLCGAIAYEMEQHTGRIVHCHCRTCQKAQGAAFSSNAFVAREHFRWIHGQELLSWYESSPGKNRYFCSVCGSHLVAMRDGQPNVIVRVATLDEDAKPVSFAHGWVSHDLPWLKFGDDVPAYDEFPPADV
ncbi:MAG: aldehyde-activating protein [Zetaproteobacteria bacterium CG06_land_8_20_14_3_00_59_53]|nr:MAG: aldehyde-activating protein [Zetaproteobacteria bacterium CG2_30_59_37]PIO90908.1 MAG: aldehyde-activating protein [Zetaproteobacteria bacterium CG23_combo_of_CG06-09_8_20_14_all_59_86]PIQ64122.1 MAG: aldehyde-activating protein [Zetaproteobacteria bacterium CG11_big_fil_rev_8_21_14_0_20_59_439]PIU71089.1 MAG: aldehyde-activating protein [Zetaproteobacteria bacterium CG06_land_8_20_14_3_00_59_53]PIU96083.1 MAG: aldehyde-activating protein [Zetaproteobacteria bacterium CG03_land_8_20_14_